MEKKPLSVRLETDPVFIGNEQDLTEKRLTYNASRTGSAFLMSYDEKVQFKCMRGPVGNGKSVLMCMYIVHKSQQQTVIEVTEKGRKFKVRWSKWLLMRHTERALADTVKETWDQWFGDKTRWVTDPMEGRYEDYAPDGILTRIDFVCLGALSKNIIYDLQSLELSGAWINEATQCPYKIVGRVFSRLKRFNPCPSAKVVLKTFHVIMDTNSPNETNWWRRMEEVQKPKGWMFFICPPAILEERDPLTGERVFVPNDVEHAAKRNRRPAENVKEIDGGYHVGFDYWMDQINVLDEDDVRMLLQNEYGISQGGMGIYSDLWDVARHRVGENLAVFQRGMRLVAGMDTGRTPACVIGQMRTDGKLVILREVTTWNPLLNKRLGGLERMDVITFFDKKLRPVLVNEFNWPECDLTIFADPAGANMNEVVPVSTIDNLAKERKVNVVSCDSVQPLSGEEQDITQGNNTDIRINCVRDALRTGDLLVYEGCTMLCAAMAGKYHYEQKPSRRGDGAEVYSDKPEKDEWSHISDAAQYLCLAVFKGAEDYSKPIARIEARNYAALTGGWGGSDYGVL